MIGTKTYIYGLLDKSDNIIYLGKSSCPKNRLRHHKHISTISITKCKILDIFYDTENYWINKLLSEGIVLKNKYNLPEEESWEIGDIIEVGSLKKVKVKNTETGIVYDTIKSACESIGMQRDAFVYKIKKGNNEIPFIFI